MNWALKNAAELLQLTAMHAYQALFPLLLGLIFALLAGKLAASKPGWRSLILGLGSVLFTVPSLALFVVLPLILGTQILDVVNVLVTMTIYSFALLVHSSAAAFSGIDRHVIDASRAMGYTPIRRFFEVELPLSIPVLFSGLRVVAVSNIAGVSVGALIGVPNLGYLFKDGLNKDFPPEIITGLILTVALAGIVDFLLVMAQKLLTPWEARRS